jgi:hypothetical protein
MGEIVSIEEFRRARAAIRPDPRPAFDPIERLSVAVGRLETALGEADGFDEPDVRRELAAVHGAVASGRYRFAAERTERLIERLGRSG